MNMERKDIRGTMAVILVVWFVMTCVIFMGWVATSEQVYDPEVGRKVMVRDEEWSTALNFGVIGSLGLGFLIFLYPSPRNSK